MESTMNIHNTINTHFDTLSEQGLMTLVFVQYMAEACLRLCCSSCAIHAENRLDQIAQSETNAQSSFE